MATNKPTITDIQDTFTTLVTNQNTISLDLGATGRLNTNEDSSAVAAINELELGIRGTSDNLVATDLADFTSDNIVSALHELDSDLHGAGGGNAKADLTTNADDIVSGINELELAIRGTSNNLAAVQLRTTKTHLVGAVNELDSDIGARPHTTLTTDAKTLTGAVNELDAELGTITDTAMGTTATTVSGAIAELDSDRDRQITYTGIDGTALTTTATTLTTAVNELDAEIGAAVLVTSATTLRGAINELHIEMGAIPDSNGSGNLRSDRIGQSIRLLDSAVGNLAQLNTDGSISSRTSLVTVVNSLADDISLLDSDAGVRDNRLGSLSNLTAGFVGTERDNFVNALNALRADVPLIYDVNGTQLN
jgi:hypothetical protein